MNNADTLFNYYVREKKFYQTDYNMVQATEENIVGVLNRLFYGEWTYNQNIEYIEDFVFVKVALYIPGACMQGTSCRLKGNTDFNIFKTMTNEALYDAFDQLYKRTYNKPESINVVKDSKEISNKETPNAVNENKIFDEAINKNTEKETKDIPSSNKPGVLKDVTDFEADFNEDKKSNETTKEQIDYILNFKQEYCSGKKEGLNIYIKEWSDNKGYDIKNTKELNLAGSFIVEEFITWTKEIINKKQEKNSFVLPI